jgi:pyruvate formate lyase activating enzyme
MTSGQIFNIQRYSIHDGPGIRTTVFLKGCPLRCFWCQNPESQSSRIQVLYNRAKCTLCGRCAEVCPSGATRLSDGHITIDRDRCTGCGECVGVCLNEARRIAGSHATVQEIMDEVMRDVKFYENSGGGVTLSGGEPLAQPDFALEILKNCKTYGLHTTIDTCGVADWATIETLLGYVDLFLFDIKVIDPEIHQRGTGRRNEQILENAIGISGRTPMRVRVPLIPGFNDSEEAILQIARFAKNELGSPPIDLLPYNKFGEVKYELLDKRCHSLETQSEQYVSALESAVEGVRNSG